MGQDHRTHGHRSGERAASRFIHSSDVPVIGPEICFVREVRILDHTNRGVHYAEYEAGLKTCAESLERRLFCCLH